MADILREPRRSDNVHDELFVKVFEVAGVTIDRTWNARDVCSGYWRLYVNAGAGACLILADGRAYPLAPRRVHLVPAWVRFSCRNSRRFRHRYVHFDLIGVPAAQVRRAFTKPLTLPSDRTLARLADALGAAASGATAVCRAKSLVYAALAAVLAERPEAGAGLRADDGATLPAVRFIEDHLGERLRVRDLAARCHLSEDHFGRVFRQRLGLSPAQYVIERRLAAASQALAFGTESIEQLAERLGFASRFHLTRLFSRRMGVPPAAYRRRARV